MLHTVQYIYIYIGRSPPWHGFASTGGLRSGELHQPGIRYHIPQALIAFCLQELKCEGVAEGAPEDAVVEDAVVEFSNSDSASVDPRVALGWRQCRRLGDQCNSASIPLPVIVYAETPLVSGTLGESWVSVYLMGVGVLDGCRCT
jgi:hypothetical protein